MLPQSGDKPPPAPAPPEPHHLFSPERKRFSILIVDDEPAKRYSMARALAVAGYQVTEVGSAADALMAFHQHHAVILDVYLPDMFGFDVCRAMRFSAPDLPILQVSSVLTEERYQREGLDAGASAYLSNPDIQELLRTVDALLGVPHKAPPPVH